MHPAQVEELKILFERSVTKEMLDTRIKLWRLVEKESGITHIIAVVDRYPVPIHYMLPAEFKLTSAEGRQFGQELQRFIEGHGSDVLFRAAQLLMDLGFWAVEGGGKRKLKKVTAEYATTIAKDIEFLSENYVVWQEQTQKAIRNLIRRRDTKYGLAERVLNAMAELRTKGTRVTKTNVAVNVYGRKGDREQDLMARRVQLRRDLREAELTFEKLFAVNKKWSELSRVERQNLFS
jgi:hypothetical protein